MYIFISIILFHLSLQNYEYLVKWDGYNTDECTWEPEINLPNIVISNFIPSSISEERLRQFSVSFERAIQTRLKSKTSKFAVYVDFDVFRFVFGSETTVLCSKDSFSKLKMTEHWYYNIKKDGNRNKMKALFSTRNE